MISLDFSSPVSLCISIRSNFPATAASLSARKFVAGAGVNDADYKTKIITSNGKEIRCPCYVSWKHMIERCFCKKLKSRYKTYEKVTCCKEWISFMKYREWWLLNVVDGWQLDKDILSSSSEYGAYSCIFVPSWINSFVNTQSLSRGGLPIGVSWNIKVNKYVASCSHPMGWKEHLGCFTNHGDAHNAWLKRKLEIALELKPKMDEIDERIYHGVVRIIKNAT